MMTRMPVRMRIGEKMPGRFVACLSTKNNIAIPTRNKNKPIMKTTILMEILKGVPKVEGVD